MWVIVDHTCFFHGISNLGSLDLLLIEIRLACQILELNGKLGVKLQTLTHLFQLKKNPDHVVSIFSTLALWNHFSINDHCFLRTCVILLDIIAWFPWQLNSHCFCIVCLVWCSCGSHFDFALHVFHLFMFCLLFFSFQLLRMPDLMVNIAFDSVLH